MEWPNLQGEYEPKSGSGPFDPAELNADIAKWYRYIFHDGKVAIERNGYIDKATRRKHLRNVEFSCVFPFTHGSSLAVNTALLLSDSERLVPFTDSKLHHEMLAIKYQRIATIVASDKSPIFGVRTLHPEKLRRVALTLLDVMVPEEIIENMSITQCLKYRDASSDAFQRLRIFIGDLASQIESEPMTDKFEKEIQKIVHQKVLPEAQKARDKGIEIYEQLFGKIAKRAAAAVTPTLGASIVAGLSSPVMLAIASAAALGAILPDLLDALLAERTARRNAISYLLELK